MKNIAESKSLLQLAVKLHQQGRLYEAQSLYSKVLATDNTNVLALTNLGSISFQLGDYQRSLQLNRVALQIEPRNTDALYNQGRTFHEIEDWDLAVSNYKACLKQKPDHKNCLENLAALLLSLGDYEAGLPFAQKLVRIVQNHKSLRLLGQCLIGQGDYQQGYKIYNDALRNSPARPELRYITAISNLKKGEFRSGWLDFHLRWSTGDFLGSNKPKPIPVKRWYGESLVDKYLFVSSEQGIGDEVMYASCLKDLQELAENVALECDSRLVDIYNRSFPGVKTIPLFKDDSSAQIDWTKFDYTCSIADLPQFLRLTKDSYKVEPWLAPDEDKKRDWSDRLEALPGLKIGISWFGGSADRDKAKRSIELGQLVKVFDSLKVSLISLQYSAVIDEVVAVSGRSKNIVSVMENLDCRNDIDSLVSLIDGLDLVITVDNATAHFAGSVGTPVWLLLPLVSDWRWLESDTSSYWYENMRLFRNESSNNWNAVVSELSTALTEFIPEKRLETIAFEVNANGFHTVAKSVPTIDGEKVLLVNDTLNWYHWGCSCTSLAIYDNLIAKGYQVSSYAISDLLNINVFPDTSDQFDDQSVLDRFVSENPELIEVMQNCDRVVINGEGTLHNTSRPALVLLYIAYIAKQALKKNVQIINHSCFPDDLAQAKDANKVSIYQKVYKCLDFFAVRDQYSFEICKAMGVNPTLSFDCLPLFLRNSDCELSGSDSEDRISFGASALSDNRYLKFIKKMINDNKLSQSYQFDFIVGARAHLASDDVEFVDKLSSYYPSKFNIVFCNSESEWLSQIRRSKLLISGRFHYSIAAACLGTPFLLFSSNTPKNTALMHRLDDYPGNLLEEFVDPISMVWDALTDPQKYVISSGLREEIEHEAMNNFLGC